MTKPVKLPKSVADILDDIVQYEPVRRSPQHCGGPTNRYRDLILSDKSRQIELKSILNGSAAVQAAYVARILAEYAAENPGKTFSGKSIPAYDARHVLHWSWRHQRTILVNLIESIAKKLETNGLDEFAKAVRADVKLIKVENDEADSADRRSSEVDLTDFSW